MNGYKIVILKAILCFIGCRKVNGYAPEYVHKISITLLFISKYVRIQVALTRSKKYGKKQNSNLFRLIFIILKPQ